MSDCLGKEILCLLFPSALIEREGTIIEPKGEIIFEIGIAVQPIIG